MSEKLISGLTIPVLHNNSVTLLTITSHFKIVIVVAAS